MSLNKKFKILTLNFVREIGRNWSWQYDVRWTARWVSIKLFGIAYCPLVFGRSGSWVRKGLSSTVMNRIELSVQVGAGVRCLVQALFSWMKSQKKIQLWLLIQKKITKILLLHGTNPNPWARKFTVEKDKLLLWDSPKLQWFKVGLRSHCCTK